MTFRCFHNKKLFTVVFVKLIFIEKVSEYEILFIYVKNTYRRKDLANYLLNNIYNQKKQNKVENKISKSRTK